MDDIGLVQELFKTEAARARGEQISEFKIARLYADSMWSDITEMMDNGVSKANIVGLIMITARIGRTAAYNVVSNKINSAANRNRKVKIKSEVSKESGAEQKASPVAAAPVPAPKPVQPVVQAKPAPAPVSTPTPATSASAESDQPVDKWAHLRGNNIIVGKGFLGEEERWMTPEEIKADKDRRAAIERASIISAELSKKT